MIVTTSWISQNYNKFNKLYFGGSLPTIKFKVNNSKRFWGYASFIYDWNNNIVIPEAITISNYYDSPENVKIQTLLHEMIHIEDYFWHPEHFIRNHRRISKRSYNAHGYWFQKEAKRISEESGYAVDVHVTNEEMNVSILSKSVKKNIENRKNNALICAVIGNNGIWYFKTDVFKVNYLKTNIRKEYDWTKTVGELKTIKFYTFDNPSLAAKRSCGKILKGWKTDKFGFMNKMKEFKATEIHF